MCDLLDRWYLAARQCGRAARLVVITLSAAQLGYCMPAAAAGTPTAPAPTAPIAVRWEVVRAGQAEAAPQSADGIVTITNRAAAPLPALGWSLYFTCLAGLETGAMPGAFEIERVAGSFYRLRPVAGHAELAPGESIRTRVRHSEVPANASLAPMGLYLAFDTDADAGLPISEFELAPLPVAHDVRTPEQTYARNALIATVPQAQLPPVFPTPQAYERRTGSLRWTAPPRIAAPAALRAEAQLARAMLAPYFASGSAAVGTRPGVQLALAPVSGQSSPEAYELSIEPLEGVTLRANSAAGISRGLASLRELLPLRPTADHTVELPAMVITDAPRFAYRGVMLDVARNFQPKAAVLRLLELMSRFKLNVFHFHLTDDEGWRLEIAGLPELTAVGARRGHGWQRGDRLPPAYGSGPDARDPYASGYYTRGDYIEILRYAAARHIEVIPEIEMPGHARAAVLAMAVRSQRLARAGQAADRFLLSDPHDASRYQTAQLYTDDAMNPGMASTYRFIAHVVEQLVAMHAAAGVPLRSIHVGGDELPAGAWEQSPACQALMQREQLSGRAALWDYFYRQVTAILGQHGLAASGWEELGTRAAVPPGKPEMVPNPAFANRGVTLYVWRNIEGAEDLAYRLANAGYDTVLTPANRLYFDLMPYPGLDEPGQNWAGYVDLDTVFDYVPYDDARAAPDDPTPLAGVQALTESGRRHIRGLEGTLFTETVHEAGRLDYMLMPRLLALAERAWAADPAWARASERAQAAPLHAAAWSTFVSQLGLQVLPGIDAGQPDLRYRIPPPGLARIDGAVQANEQLPGLSLHYTADGSEPTAASPTVSAPITAAAVIRVRAFDHNGRGGQTARIDNR
jgi:hexosaminidase